MKRTCILLLSALFLLSGCGKETEDLNTILKEAMNQTAQETMNTTLDMNKKLYSYYLEPGIGRRESNQTSTILLKQGYSFVMNLDISGILIEQYYQDSVDETTSSYTLENQIAKLNGSYTDYSFQQKNYELVVYELNTETYLLTLQTPYFNFLAQVPYGAIKPIAVEMMRVARATKVHKSLVIANYSLKESVKFIKEPLDLFQQEIPENGRLDEMNNHFNSDIDWGNTESTDPEAQLSDLNK